MFPLRFGKYIATRELGRGGSAVVYAAQREGDTAPSVALKVGRIEGEGASSRGRFLDEAEKLSRVDDRAVVRVIEAGELESGEPFIAMALCEGGTLAERIALGPIPLAEAFDIFESIAGGLSALHGVGLLHRDIKPENVVLVADGGATRPVLIDLGIAKDTALPASTTTHQGVVRGTPACMAPERFFGQPAAVATDVYEAALLFYVMVAGRSPWLDDADVDQRLDATPLADLAPVPLALSDVVMRALSTRAARRPGSIAALVDELVGARSAPSAERATAAIVTRSTAPPSAEKAQSPPLEPSLTNTAPEIDSASKPSRLEPAPLTHRSARRSRVVSGALGAVAGGALIAAVFAALRDPEPEASAARGALPPASETTPEEVLAASAAPPVLVTPPASGGSAATSVVASASALAIAPLASAKSLPIPPACSSFDQYICDHYGVEACDGAKANTKTVAPTMNTPATRAAWGKSCQSALSAAIARDEPLRSAERSVKASPTCQRVKPASCTADIVNDPVTKPFCTQGEVMARNCTLMLTADKAEECCATFLSDLPRLVTQRRQQLAGDPAAKQDTLEKYGLHKMPPPPAAP
jgi:serine/threonine protein kinase